MPLNLTEKIKNAGVVGAGGAGFPTHIKFRGQIETLIANGAECEPLLAKDKAIMRHFAPQVAEGLGSAGEWLSAKSTIVGIKSKNKDEIDALKKSLPIQTKIHLMADVYPAGDEFVLVYETTGKLIPPGGIPLEIGCVVSNVETLYNIGLAVNDIPVTEKFITVAGAVKNPCTFKIPLGISYKECIEIAGGATVDEYAILSGGAMMGELITDITTPITKTTAGLIILPKDHQQIKRRSLSQEKLERIGASACDQCYRCTDLCPRWILGYQIVPHEVMRSLQFSGPRWDEFSMKALLCIECNICSLYACPEDLDPKNVCTRAKRELMARGIRPDKTRPVQAHALRPGRQVPTRLLTRKLGLSQYDLPAPYVGIVYEPGTARIPLKQHAGTAAIPVVSINEKVIKGQLIGDIAPDAVGARVHASISGTIAAIDKYVTIIKD
jgi:Na+-translocating ferredoxin:NAD+ oxidoreductase RnfC subunit